MTSLMIPMRRRLKVTMLTKSRSLALDFGHLQKIFYRLYMAYVIVLWLAISYNWT